MWRGTRDWTPPHTLQPSHAAHCPLRAGRQGCSPEPATTCITVHQILIFAGVGDPGDAHTPLRLLVLFWSPCLSAGTLYRVLRVGITYSLHTDSASAFPRSSSAKVGTAQSAFRGLGMQMTSTRNTA